MDSNLQNSAYLPSSSSKIKISCILSDSCDEFNLEVSNKISIKTLKRRISEKLKYQKGKAFNVIYNEKDLTNFNKLKLSDIFSRNSNDISTDYFQTDSNSLDSVRLKIIPRTISYCPSETKLKYMLECQNHLSENAHYYCFDCQKSFCSLCIEEHSTHDYLDKYDYSKSNEDIVDNIMKNFLFEIINHEKEQEDNLNVSKAHYLSILNGNEKEECYSSLTSKDKIKELSDRMIKVYDDYIEWTKLNCMDRLKEKSDDFQDHLNKFRSICLNNLAFAHNKKCITDIIALDDDYFKEIRSTLNELKIGKDALMKYLQARNDECVNEYNDIDNFNKEITSDIESIILKIQTKMGSTPFNHHLTSSEDDKLNTIKEIYIPDIKSINSIEQETQSMINCIHSQSESFMKQYSQYIMKRKLIHEIFIYDITKKEFKSTKTYKTDKSKFKKFLKFSVFININDTLYISGGKNKEEKCVKDFYAYSVKNNTLRVLPSMYKERCSHSMIYVNTDKIQNEVFVIGGFSNNTCEKYSIDKKKWRKLPDLLSKEKQVPTLFLINNSYLYCAFGFSNDTIELPDLAEMIDLNKLDAWMNIPINNTIGKYDLKRFNVGIAQLSQNEFFLFGGEKYKGEETDSVFSMTVNISEGNPGNITVSSIDSLTLPLKCSFIDKQFIEIKPNKFAQFEMKKNNLIIFNSIKKQFKIKPF